MKSGETEPIRDGMGFWTCIRWNRGNQVIVKLFLIDKTEFIYMSLRVHVLSFNPCRGRNVPSCVTCESWLIIVEVSDNVYSKRFRLSFTLRRYNIRARSIAHHIGGSIEESDRSFHSRFLQRWDHRNGSFRRRSAFIPSLRYVDVENHAKKDFTCAVTSTTTYVNASRIKP